MAGNIVLDGLGHGSDHLVRPGPQVRDSGVRIKLKTDAVDITRPETRNVQRGLTQRLGRDTCVKDGGAAGPTFTLDDRYAAAKIRRLRPGLFSGRAGADHDHVERLWFQVRVYSLQAPQPCPACEPFYSDRAGLGVGDGLLPASSRVAAGRSA